MTRLDQLTDAVEKILLAHWDPIGVGDVRQAADEYDEYALYVARMLAKGSSHAELSRYLLEIERATLGLKGDPARARRVAAKLLTIADG